MLPNQLNLPTDKEVEKTGYRLVFAAYCVLRFVVVVWGSACAAKAACILSNSDNDARTAATGRAYQS